MAAMEVCPIDNAVTRPLASTDATFGALELQVRELADSCVPFSDIAASVSTSSTSSVESRPMDRVDVFGAVSEPPQARRTKTPVVAATLSEKRMHAPFQGTSVERAHTELHTTLARVPNPVKCDIPKQRAVTR